MKKTYKITIFRPGGNDQLIVKGIVRKGLKRSLNDSLIEKFPNVEQVSFYEKNKKEKTTQLELAGGEFCGNATRSLVYLLLGKEKGEVFLNVSGTTSTLKAGVRRKNTAYAQMPIIKTFENGKKITIRQLLSHTSGMPDHEKPLYKKIKKGDEPTIYDALDVLRKKKQLLFPSGTKYEYSNSGFVLLALIIEKVTNKKYRDFLKEDIFNPLGMTNTLVVDETKPKIKNRALGYQKKGNAWELYDYDPLNYIVGDEGIYSTVKDLARWKKAWDTEILVTKKTLQEALENQTLNNGGKSRCGFSWFIEYNRV